MLNLIQKTYTGLKFKYLHRSIHTPLDTAVKENYARRQDIGLMKEIDSFLKSDTPEHFSATKPIFYLSRYIATPDYETLNYFKQVQSYNWPVIIGEDTTDIFTTHSSLKRNLLKLPIVTGTTKYGESHQKFITIADFNSEQGKQLRDVRLLDSTPLTEFHQKLCKKFLPRQIIISDESTWVDKHNRGSLLQLYEQLLPLFLVHGVMLEQYELDEIDFLENVVCPAFETTKKRFGCQPLIAPLNQAYSKKLLDLNSYPKEVGDYVNEILTP